MRLSPLPGRVVLALVFALPLGAQRVERIPALDSARRLFLEALATKDTAKIRDAFTDDAITLFRQPRGGQTNSGLPAIVAFYGGLFARVSASLEMRFTPDAVTRNGEDTALETGAWQMPAFSTAGTYVTVYRRAPDGRWRITFWRAGPASG
jgi:ketosteroid isomerase-like protein